MLASRPRRLRLALLVGCCSALLFGALAPGRAAANDCAFNNVFQMGVLNTCNDVTNLYGSAYTEFIAQTGAPNGVGVAGVSWATTGEGDGVLGTASSTGDRATGVKGYVSTASATTGSYSAGVAGFNKGTNFGGFGVWGRHEGQGIGVYGEAPNGFAVSGFSPNNWSGYFQGSVRVVGTLIKSSGAFRIDHPLDPAHKYLQHSFVESPEMMNVYNGNVVTNGHGYATVKLPAWFQALNRDFRYQLTPLGHNGWGARAVVWDEVRNNHFTIRSEPRVKISWQVTGVRHDAYANAHRIQTVVPKTGSADGKYVHPELYGKPMTKSVVVLPGMDGK